jgi:hypothetical protein
MKFSGIFFMVLLMALSAQAETPSATMAPAATASSEPLTPAVIAAEDRQALASMLRLGLVKESLAACAKKMPGRQSRDAKKIAAWEQKNLPVLNRAIMYAMKNSSRQDVDAAAQLILDEETASFRKHTSTNPTTENCNKIADSLDKY